MAERNRAAPSANRGTALTNHKHHDVTAEGVVLTIKDVPRVDSRVLARHLHARHKAVFELIRNHVEDFQELGKVPFQTEALPSGQLEKFAMLSEDQCYLVLAYMRNTVRVRQLKVRLVKAFRDARKAAEMRELEYRPTYHQLHDLIAKKAAGSAHERHVHVNVNRLVNKMCGLQAGQRPTAPLAQQAMLTMAQIAATNAMSAAVDHRDGYQRAKAALLAFSSAVALPCSQQGGM